MAIEIKMPQLSDTMHSGKIIAWHKKEGDPITRGDILAEIETDKATLEIESFHQGVLLKIVVPSDASADVGQTIAYLGVAGEVVSEKSDPQITVQDKTEHEETLLEESTPSSAQASQTAPVKASPLAKRIAKENKIDLSVIKGSGPAGRILRKDVELFVTNIGSNVGGKDKLTPRSPEIDGESSDRGNFLSLSKMRQTIAQRMETSFREIPHFYVTVSVKMRAVIELRRHLKNSDDFKNLSITHFIVKATANALLKEPLLNSCYRDGKLYQPNDINIGIVAAVNDGLLIPVVKDCAHLSLAELITATRSALERARTGKLNTSDLNEGTFTISNLGKYNVESFTAIINPGQGAILAVGSIHNEAYAEDGRLVVMPILRVTLGVDHRVCDGAKAAVFLNHFKAGLEQPAVLFIPL